MKPIDRPQVEAITRKLTDDGLIIEAGWVLLRAIAIPPNAPQVQIDEMQTAFFAGADHLFSSIMCMLDADREPTDNDMRRMSQIQGELDYFARKFKERYGL